MPLCRQINMKKKTTTINESNTYKCSEECRKEKETAMEYYARTHARSHTQTISYQNRRDKLNELIKLTCTNMLCGHIAQCGDPQKKKWRKTLTQRHAHMHSRCVFFFAHTIVVSFFFFFAILNLCWCYFISAVATAAAAVPHPIIQKRRRRKWCDDCVFETHSYEPLCRPTPTINKSDKTEKKPKKPKHILSSFCFYKSFDRQSFRCDIIKFEVKNDERLFIMNSIISNVKNRIENVPNCKNEKWRKQFSYRIIVQPIFAIVFRTHTHNLTETHYVNW